MTRTVSILVLMLFAGSLWAKPTLRVDRKTVHVEESFTLKISSDTPIKQAPDFNNMPDGLQVLGTTQFQNSSFIGMKRTYEMGWNVQIIALRAGKFVIPSFNIDGTPTQPITITVLGSTAGQPGVITKPLYAKIRLSETHPYVQQQVELTYQIFSNSDISRPQLMLPDINNTIVRQLDGPTRYTSRKGAILYRVYEYRFLLFPQQPGTLTIPSAKFRGDKILRYRRNDPFQMFGNTTRPVVLNTPPKQLSVKPKPILTGLWLPAKTLTLEEHWRPDSARIEVGKPVTRIISISATGLDSSQLPDLKSPLLNGISIFPDKPKLNSEFDGENIRSSKTESFALLANQPGRYELPAIKIRWWNETLGTFEVARLPAHELIVYAASTSKNVNSAPGAAHLKTSEPGNSPTAAKPKQAGNENSAGGRASEHNNPVIAETSGIWKKATLAITLLWLATLGLSYYLNRKLHKKTRATGPPPSVSVSNRSSGQKRVNWEQLGSSLAGAQPRQIYTAIVTHLPPQCDYDTLIERARKQQYTDLADRLTALARSAFYAQQELMGEVNLPRLMRQVKCLLQTDSSSAQMVAPLYPFQSKQD